METYTFKQLDESYLEKASRCLGETFVGVQKSHYIIDEPVIIATKLTVDEFTEICRLYLESTYNQGYHFIAIDNETDEVVGVIGADVFDPNLEEEPFEGNLAKMNHAIDLLETLDILFIEKFEHVVQRKIKKGDLLHGFLIGVQAPKNKRIIAKKLVDLVLEKAKEQGITGFFVEATNPRSQGLIVKEFNGYLPTDIKGDSIMTVYKNDPFFNVIPTEVAESLQILYIPLNDSISLK